VFTIETSPYDNGETLAIIRNEQGREVGSLIISPRTSGAVGVEVWQFADDSHPLHTVEIPAAK
jgi:hypothetical protein